MATCTNTGLSVSYAYKKGCRCEDCKANKRIYTKQEGPKARERVRLWLLAHPEAKKTYSKRCANKTWLIKFGELCKQQNGVCAICQRSTSGMTTSKLRLSVDHCHKTGKIRGLLCGSCNVGLGHFKDDTNLLKLAIIYLEVNK